MSDSDTEKKLKRWQSLFARFLAEWDDHNPALQEDVLEKVFSTTNPEVVKGFAAAMRRCGF